jgi:hypothetical protein
MVQARIIRDTVSLEPGSLVRESIMAVAGFGRVAWKWQSPFRVRIEGCGDSHVRYIIDSTRLVSLFLFTMAVWMVLKSMRKS